MTPNIILIGSGNLAWHIVRWAKSGGVELKLYGRDAAKLDEWQRMYGFERIERIEDVDHQYVVYAINDDVVEKLSRAMGLQKSHEIHLSGTLPLEVLHSSKRSVCWPVASLKEGVEEKLTEIPWVVQGEYRLPFIKKYTEVGDNEERVRLHLAAVVMNNFVYHLGKSVQDFSPQATDVLSYLMQQTIDKISASGDLQTGPASRGDVHTVFKHLELLRSHEGLRELYHLFSKQIAAKNGHKL
jgi:hypothetical protein